MCRELVYVVNEGTLPWDTETPTYLGRPNKNRYFLPIDSVRDNGMLKSACMNRYGLSEQTHRVYVYMIILIVCSVYGSLCEAKHLCVSDDVIRPH